MAAANRDGEALLDIVDAAQQIQAVVQSLTLEAFKSNREKQAAVLYFCITIGEATKRISQAKRTQHPDIPWNLDSISVFPYACRCSVILNHWSD
jgi:uncharacterized protein with HEPN domain